MKKLKNFINVRIETSNHEKEIVDVKHNVREVESKGQINNDKNYHFILNDDNKFQSMDEEGCYDRLSPKLRELRKEHSDLFKENNPTKIRNRNSTLLGVVITFSEKIEKDYNDGELDKKQFIKDGKDTLLRIAKQLDTELLYFSVHFDEKTPHFHAHFKNFDEKGSSVSFKHRTKDKLSILQDIGFKGFHKNFGVDRGIKKSSDHNVQNQKLKVHYEKEKAKMVDEYNKGILDLQNKLKQLNKDLKVKRKEFSNYEMENDEIKKQQYSKITKQQKQIRQFQDEIRILKSSKDVKDDEYNQLLEKHRNVEENATNIIFELNTTISELKGQIHPLKKELQLLKDENEKLKEDVRLKDVKYDNLFENHYDLDYMKEHIEFLEEDNQQKLEKQSKSSNNSHRSHRH